MDTSIISTITKAISEGIQSNMIILISLIFLGYIGYILIKHYDHYKDYLESMK